MISLIKSNTLLDVLLRYLKSVLILNFDFVVLRILTITEIHLCQRIKRINTRPPCVVYLSAPTTLTEFNLHQAQLCLLINQMNPQITCDSFVSSVYFMIK